MEEGVEESGGEVRKRVEEGGEKDSGGGGCRREWRSVKMRVEVENAREDEEEKGKKDPACKTSRFVQCNVYLNIVCGTFVTAREVAASITLSDALTLFILG